MTLRITIFLTLFLVQKSKAQNVGIGTTNPTRGKLEVVGVAGGGNTAAIFGSDGAGISLQTNSPAIGFNQYRDNPSGNGKYMASGYAAVQYFDPAAGVMAIDMLNAGAIGTNTPNGYRAITISNTGVGIRYPAPNASLAVGRGDGNDGTVVIAGAQHWSHFNYSTAEDTYIRAGIDNGNVYINQGVSNGNVLIGNGSAMIGIALVSFPPLATIHVQENAGVGELRLSNEYNNSWLQATQYVYNPTQLILFLRYNGVNKGFWNPSVGYYEQYSDLRLKKNIQPLEPVLDKIKELKPVGYEMINHNPEHKRSIGFIAQDVKQHFPSLVRVIDDHNRKGITYKDLHTMNYTGFNVIAIKALQEQYQQIKELEKEQEQLMQQLQELMKKIPD